MIKETIEGEAVVVEGMSRAVTEVNERTVALTTDWSVVCSSAIDQAYWILVDGYLSVFYISIQTFGFSLVSLGLRVHLVSSYKKASMQMWRSGNNRSTPKKLARLNSNREAVT